MSVRERIEARINANTPTPVSEEAMKASQMSVGDRIRERVGKTASVPVAAPTAPTEAPIVSAAKGAANMAQEYGVLDVLGGKLDTVAGIGETGLTMGMGMLGEVAGGLAGGTTALFKGADAGVEVLEDVKDFFIYEPKTETAKDILGGFASAMEPVGQALQSTSQTLGDTAYDVTGSPAVAAAFYTLPDAAMELAGLGVGAKAYRAAKLSKAAQDVKDATEALADPRVRLGTDTGAKWSLGKDGVAVPNVEGRKLMKAEAASGGQAAMITNSNRATKNQMIAMTESFNELANDNVPALKPTQIIGASAGKALKEANEARKAIGKKLDEVVSGPLGETPVDLRPAVSEFYLKLREAGVSTTGATKGKPELDFRGTDFELDTYASSRKVLNDAFQITLDARSGTLKDAHSLKKRLDDLIDAKKLEQGGQLGNTSRDIETLRNQINEAAKGVKEYEVVNKQYRAMKKGLSKFDAQRPVGSTWDDAETVNNLGTALRDTTLDNNSVNNLLEGLSEVNKTMISVGAKPFTVDVAALGRYNNFLEGQWKRSILDSSPKGGFLRGAAKNAQALALSSMVSNKFAQANSVAGLVTNGIDARIAANVAKEARRQQKMVLSALKK